MMKNLRYVVYPKDLIPLLGREDSYCREWVRIIKRKENLEKHQILTYVEVAKHLRLSEVNILRAINHVDVDLTTDKEKEKD
ncbi:hypothetical protein ACFQO1_04060 [Jejudonia soesokkakensis]|uniref:Uncharacterized protein n=1 Tax=Jejudonia soesokkakensis TaxID=1323432 RepID=A0ABW2MPP3_9FLAO